MVRVCRAPGSGHQEAKKLSELTGGKGRYWEVRAGHAILGRGGGLSREAKAWQPERGEGSIAQVFP